MRVDVLVPPEAVQSPSAWEIENVISQFIVPLVTVEEERPVKLPLVSEAVTRQVTVPLDEAWVNVELSVALAAREKFELTVL